LETFKKSLPLFKMKLPFSLKENIEILRKITIYRFFNGLKVVTGFYLSRLLKKPFSWGMPLSISFEPTNLCNLSCPECPTGLKILTRRTGNANFHFFTKTIDEIYKSTSYLTLYFQGEPYLNPDFLRMVLYASQKKMFVLTSTNGHYFTENNCIETIKSGLSKLIVSIDGTTQDIYETYRSGGKLETVTDGLRRLVETKKKLKAQHPFIVIQFIVFRQNEHQINDIIKLAEEIGVDHLALKTAQIYDYEANKNSIPLNTKYSRYKKQKDGTYKIKNKFYNHCWRSWQSCVVTWDGQIVPCCFDKDAKYKMGSLKENSFTEIWKSQQMNQFRKKILTARKEIDICRNCTEGTKIWI